MTMQVINIEAQLAGWSTSHKGGSKLVLWVNDEDLDPFKAMTTREGKKAGQRLALAVVQIGDDERPVPQPEPDPQPANTIKGGDLARMAGNWCKQPAFQQWIGRTYDRFMGGPGDDPSEDVLAKCGGPEGFARIAICTMCSVPARRFLDHVPKAKEAFLALIREPFLDHQKTMAKRKAQECEA